MQLCKTSGEPLPNYVTYLVPGRECNSTEVTKNRNGHLATKGIGMAGHLAAFNRFVIGLQYTNPIIKLYSLRIGARRYLSTGQAYSYTLQASEKVRRS